VTKGLPTAFHLAGDKDFFADKVFAMCSLRTATWKVVGKAFTTCFRAFADCFWQSAKRGIPVMTGRNLIVSTQHGTVRRQKEEATASIACTAKQEHGIAS